MQNEISIAPALDLETTAHSIGRILGLNFKRDLSGNYEEFPAYIALSGDSEYVLLGNPDPKYDIRDFKDENYELMINNDVVENHDELIFGTIEKLQDWWCRLLDNGIKLVLTKVRKTILNI